LAEEIFMSKIKVVNIPVTVTSGGVASGVSPHISGEILKIAYVKGTIDAASTLVTTETDTGDQIDSYNINTGSVVRYPCVALTGAAAGDNKWARFHVFGTLSAAGTGCAASKDCSLNIYYK
jgi:hypothetical protein